MGRVGVGEYLGIFNLHGINVPIFSPTERPAVLVFLWSLTPRFLVVWINRFQSYCGSFLGDCSLQADGEFKLQRCM